MARSTDASHIYEIAQMFADDCIHADGSLLWPGSSVWTTTNLEAFWNAFALNLDTGPDDFVTKWANQLRQESDDLYRMAVEASVIYCLFPHKDQMGIAAKLALVDSIMRMGPDLGDPSKERWDSILQAFGEGIGTTGTAYMTGRPFQIGYIFALISELKQRGTVQLGLMEAKSVTSRAFEVVKRQMGYSTSLAQNAMLHILWPDTFEGTASANNKKRIAENLSSRFGIVPSEDVDETIYRIRQYMEGHGYPPAFNMYEPPVAQLWNVTQGKQGPAENRYHLAALFRARVLEQRTSLFWPNDDTVWTNESIETALDVLRPIVHLHAGAATRELNAGLSTASTAVYRLLCDVRALLTLSTKVTKKTAAQRLDSMLNSRGAFDGDTEVRQHVIDAADRALPGAGISSATDINQMHVMVYSISRLLEHPEAIGVQDQMYHVICDTHPLGDSSMFFPIWSALHVIYPKLYPNVPLQDHRDRLIGVASEEIDLSQLTNPFAKLVAIRDVWAPDADPTTFDFYADPYRSRWLPAGSLDEDDGLKKTDEADQTPQQTEVGPTIDSLAAATHLDQDFLASLEQLLLDRKQLIFEGPPGSGKTFVAEKFARYITGQDLFAADRNEQVELIQFHQSYSYEDFVEGIRPATTDGAIHYDVRPGIFRKFADRASGNPDKPFVLIIDEINRGNISRILGELMLLLEYRTMTATLQYSGDAFAIPSNLYIIGTMNSADRSLSQIDYALRRRFNFVRFMPVSGTDAPVLRNWLGQQGFSADVRDSLHRRFVDLNRQLAVELKTDDLQVGHSYFMRSGIETDAIYRETVKYSILPLLNEYFYHRPNRDVLVSTFESLLGDRLVTPDAPAPDLPQADVNGEPVDDAWNAE